MVLESRHLLEKPWALDMSRRKLRAVLIKAERIPKCSVAALIGEYSPSRYGIKCAILHWVAIFTRPGFDDVNSAVCRLQNHYLRFSFLPTALSSGFRRSHLKSGVWPYGRPDEIFARTPTVQLPDIRAGCTEQILCVDRDDNQ